MQELLLPGTVIEFEYPAANYLNARQRWERRRLKVEEVRDLRRKPLSPLTVTLDPHLRRGTLLLRGIDLDKGSERSFYFESMQSLRVDHREPTSECDGYSVALVKELGDVDVDGVPNGIHIVKVIARGVSRIIAEVIADRAAVQAGEGLRAMILPPGFIPSAE